MTDDEVKAAGGTDDEVKGAVGNQAMKVTPQFDRSSVTQKSAFTVEFYGDPAHAYQAVVVKSDGNTLQGWDADPDIVNLLIELVTALEEQLDPPA